MRLLLIVLPPHWVNPSFMLMNKQVEFFYEHCLLKKCSLFPPSIEPFPGSPRSPLFTPRHRRVNRYIPVTSFHQQYFFPLKPWKLKKPVPCFKELAYPFLSFPNTGGITLSSYALSAMLHRTPSVEAAARRISSFILNMLIPKSKKASIYRVW